MFGKHFASMYSGSLFGKSASVFAVWGYIISTMRPSRKDGQCYVELNPTLLAATFAATTEDMLAAITDLCSPDPRSRSKSDEGRRIVPLDHEMHVGPMQFRVVNGSKYRALRDEEERRTYLREAKRKERSSTNIETVNHGQPPSSQVEVEVEVLTDSVATAPAQLRLTSTGGKPKPVAESWSREACDDWIGRFGGTAPGGQIGKALKPLVDKHGWATVRKAWADYLSRSEGEFASPPRFAATYGEWAPRAETVKPEPKPGTYVPQHAGPAPEYRR